MVKENPALVAIVKERLSEILRREYAFPSLFKESAEAVIGEEITYPVGKDEVIPFGECLIMQEEVVDKFLTMPMYLASEEGTKEEPLYLLIKKGVDLYLTYTKLSNRTLFAVRSLSGWNSNQKDAEAIYTVHLAQKEKAKQECVRQTLAYLREEQSAKYFATRFQDLLQNGWEAGNRFD